MKTSWRVAARCCITPVSRAERREALENRNANPVYGGNAERLLAALTRNGSAWRRFYTLEDCERAVRAIDNG